MTQEKPLAVITGASTGIGLELAKQFAENGYDLIIAANESKLADAQAQLEKLGAGVDRVQVDLATFEGVEELYATIKAKGKPINAIAMNAGVGVYGKFHETDLQDEINMINLNITGVVQLAKYITKDMTAQGEGKILITSSMVAEMPAPYTTVYAASKAFLFLFSESLRQELKDTGITVTALRPNATDTNFFARAGMEGVAKITDSDMEDPAKVAKQGFKALMAGDDQVIGGGIKSKSQGIMANILPETTKAKMAEGMMEPKEKKKA